MKITASKINALIFTIIAVAAFAWMTMRPSIDVQAAGFGLPSNSGSASTTATAKDSDASSEAETTDKDPTTSSTAEKESDKKSIEIKKFLDDNNIPYICLKSGKDVIQYVLKMINKDTM